MRALSGVTVLAALVLGTAASCGEGDGGTPSAPAPPATSAPPAGDSGPSQSSELPKDPNKPADGIPNNGDGDADG